MQYLMPKFTSATAESIASYSELLRRITNLLSPHIKTLKRSLAKVKVQTSLMAKASHMREDEAKTF
ncbi:hypothetical protein LguiB_020556 [Lonicera macranthoides]